MIVYCGTGFCVFVVLVPVVPEQIIFDKLQQVLFITFCLYLDWGAMPSLQHSGVDLILIFPLMLKRLSPIKDCPNR